MVVGSLAARDYKGVGNQYVNEGKVVVETFTKGKRAQTVDDDETWDENRPAPTLNQFDQGDTRATTVVVGIQGTVIGRQDHNGPGGKGHTDENGAMFTLTSTDVHAVAYSFDSLASNSMKSSNPDSGCREVDVAKTLDTARPDPSCNQGGIAIVEPVPTLVTMREGKPGGGKGPLISEDKSLSLSTGNEQTLFQPAQAAGFKPGASADARTIGYEEELSPSLEAGGGGNNKPAVVIQYDGYNQKIHVDEPSVTLRIGRDSSDFVAQPVVAPSLTASNDPSRSPQSAEVTQQVTAVHQATMAVRRLTPLECERLMGWPDDWTAGQSDTHRYKQCGNGVASPVATWIAQQLLKLDQ
jgi:hypothetical protein